ncbi:hypothetical protein ACJIZ3_005963 [Penstemon smallii]|uniref:Uncharacterized protein n=1 Tax=Penstemon smallii TaxID=265156 RepID=A0ABD3S6D9_9LAMI
MPPLPSTANKSLLLRRQQVCAASFDGASVLRREYDFSSSVTPIPIGFSLSQSFVFGEIIVSVSFSEISLSFNLGLSFQSHDSTFASEVVKLTTMQINVDCLNDKCDTISSALNLVMASQDVANQNLKTFDENNIRLMEFMKLESKPDDFKTDGNNIRFH